MIKIIAMKSKFGKIGSIVKEFKDQRHFNNWYKLMSGKGHNIIGVHNYEVQSS